MGINYLAKYTYNKREHYMLVKKVECFDVVNGNRNILLAISTDKRLAYNISNYKYELEYYDNEGKAISYKNMIKDKLCNCENTEAVNNNMDLSIYFNDMNSKIKDWE